MTEEVCQRCLRREEDCRTLYMSCGYAMHELNTVPFTPEPIGNLTVYTLRVCKECRADWLAGIQNWFTATPTCLEPSPGTGIYIRSFGGTFEVSEEEWKEIAARRGEPDREPYRVKPEAP